MELEDQPGAALSHWEARTAGSEAMSYGAALGEPFVGDVTLAMFEDQGSFVPAYTAAAGPLVAVSDGGAASAEEF